MEPEQGGMDLGDGTGRQGRERDEGNRRQKGDEPNEAALVLCRHCWFVVPGTWDLEERLVDSEDFAKMVRHSYRARRLCQNGPAARMRQPADRTPVSG